MTMRMTMRTRRGISQLLAPAFSVRLPRLPLARLMPPPLVISSLELS
jgi:hypothetical protein